MRKGITVWNLVAVTMLVGYLVWMPVICLVMPTFERSDKGVQFAMIVLSFLGICLAIWLVAYRYLKSRGLILPENS